MTGGNSVQTTVATIGAFDISQEKLTYSVPQLAPGMYFLMYAPDKGDHMWSTRFSLNGGDSWYPVGVATGTDPGTNSTSAIDTAQVSNSKSQSSSITSIGSVSTKSVLGSTTIPATPATRGTDTSITFSPQTSDTNTDTTPVDTNISDSMHTTTTKKTSTSASASDNSAHGLANIGGGVAMVAMVAGALILF